MQNWHPKTPPITGKSFGHILSHEQAVVIHFWAVWNSVDERMDNTIQQLRSRLGSGMKFYSCDIDNPINFELCKELNVVSIPCLLAFNNGKKQGHIIGLSDEVDLASKLTKAFNPKEGTSKSSWWKFWHRE